MCSSDLELQLNSNVSCSNAYSNFESDAKHLRILNKAPLNKTASLLPYQWASSCVSTGEALFLGQVEVQERGDVGGEVGREKNHLLAGRALIRGWCLHGHGCCHGGGRLSLGRSSEFVKWRYRRRTSKRSLCPIQARL